MKELTIVTEFFEIGREDYRDTHSRTNKEYLEYFKFWARMKNKLIVYTYKEMADEIKKIRDEFGLLDRTIIIEIEDETKIETDLFNRMKSIENQEYLNNYRYHKDVIENYAKYDYVMLLKYWCLMDAVKNGYAQGMVAWLDFGFNHGDDCYINSEDFNFNWETNLNENKIHLFTIKELSNEPIFELIRNMEVDIMGAPIILPDRLCIVLWELLKKAMNSLIDIGFIDDDQIILLMAYREQKEIFELHKSYWFLPLKENGAEHLTVKENYYPNNKDNKKENFNSKQLKLRRYLGYLRHQHKYFK